MPSSGTGMAIAGKVGYGLLCLVAAVVLVVSGVAWKVFGLVGSSSKGVALDGKSVGEMNILVMGLESRTNYQGQVLPNSLLTAMHAGRASAVAAGQIGSQDTNTLILLHIFAGGKKAVGFSIPRDSLVRFPQTYLGYSEGKIDAAYAWAYTQYINQHSGTESNSDLYLGANKAGQQATIDTVESLTGVQIDHFAEVNLAGFYYLAQAFGGIEVCLKPAPAQGGFAAGANLTDHDPMTGTNNSGFSAYYNGYNRNKGGAQYLHLSAAQSLAFVRSRDTLPGTDVGRTYRQQATLDYVIWKLKHSGIFSDASALNSLLGSASQYLITDSTLNLPDFAAGMQALSGSNLHFTTLPGTQENSVSVPGYPSPQSVINVNVPYIHQLVQKAFTPPVPPSASSAKPGGSTGGATGGPAAKKSGSPPAPAPPPSSITVDVYNGDPSAGGLGGMVSSSLSQLGYKAGTVGNSTAQSQTVAPGTQVFYGPGASASAAKIATEFGTQGTALSSLPADRVEVLIGSTVTSVPPGLPSPNSGTSTPNSGTGGSTSGSGSGGSPTNTNPANQGPANDVASKLGDSSSVKTNALYGIPCVY